MNLDQYLALCLAEEAGEVAQIAGKIGRFGIEDYHPMHPEGPSNAARLHAEMIDMIAVYEMMQERGAPLMSLDDPKAIEAKKRRIEQYLSYSVERGQLRLEG